MPNYVYGRLTLNGEGADEIMASLCSKDEQGFRIFDFNKIIPMPEELNVECSSRADDCLKMYAYRYALENGADSLNVLYQTSYDIPRISKDTYNKMRSKYTDEDVLTYGKPLFDNIIKYGYKDWYDWRCAHWGVKWNASDVWVYHNYAEFTTAWTPVSEELLTRLSSQYPTLKITYEYAEECIGNNCGEYSLANGEILSCTIYDDGSKEAFELAFDLVGYEDDYEFNKQENTYIFKGDEKDA